MVPVPPMYRTFTVALLTGAGHELSADCPVQSPFTVGPPGPGDHRRAAGPLPSSAAEERRPWPRTPRRGPPDASSTYHQPGTNNSTTVNTQPDNRLEF